MTKVAVLGAGGLLGRHLVELLERSGRPVAAFDRKACDVSDRSHVERALAEAGAVINCAAFTNVDRAETETAAAFNANGVGAELVGAVASARKLRAIHISTDFVFDGKKATPYDERDQPAPLSAYGKSKLEGEQRFAAACPGGAIVRVQGLYGRGGGNFASKLPELLSANKALKLDNQRKVQPTWAGNAAAQLLAILDSDVRGIVHVSSSGAATWADFTRRLRDRMGLTLAFEEVPSDALSAPAARPPNCLFDHRVLRAKDLYAMPTWEDGQDQFLADLRR